MHNHASRFGSRIPASARRVAGSPQPLIPSALEDALAILDYSIGRSPFIASVIHSNRILKAEQGALNMVEPSSKVLTIQKPSWGTIGVTRETLDKHSLGKSGLLSVDQILPEGPSHGKIQPGDILLQANNSKFESLTGFEGLLDRTIEGTIQVRIWRHGKELEYGLHVQDLFKIAPIQMVEWSGNIFHDMPFLLDSITALQSKVADYENWGGGRVVVTGIEHRQTPDLDAFIYAVRDLPGISWL